MLNEQRVYIPRREIRINWHVHVGKELWVMIYDII
jgi:hypothetical protein